ncbi:response regulator [Maribacter flavus]|uniref:dolichyl-phosphate beta-glucosyltransferase n=1 Tax=Maribacter flavus TaxID=1658664 RepID=A0A5B2TRY5_9FLAO|nr:response regulator [Maribacter flavus]KAA2216648.1 response regulator [Maribacter flavus]
MKVLAIDDQQLILLSVERRLKELGYTVMIADSGEKGIALFNSFEPDLVLVDINMPDMSGLDIVKRIKTNSKKDVPIMVMSGNTQEETIISGFTLGIDDYMKKPISLDEMAARVKRIIGAPNIETTTTSHKNDSRILQKNCVGVVIPCYNEEERLLSEEFKDFAHKNLGYHLCFVNDGSTDNTLEILRKLEEESDNNISVFDCEKNGGKAEAVRQGMLHLAKDQQLDCIGFLDADLSTDFRDFDDLVETLDQSDFEIVSGSRMSRMGANITKESARKIISMTINLIIRTILRMPFNDTQCGAKVMKSSLVPLLFEKPFITRWLFDVEIFIRIRKHFGKTKAKEMICEQPLKRWIHADGSKLSMKDSVKIVGQLAKIAISYR